MIVLIGLYSYTWTTSIQNSLVVRIQYALGSASLMVSLSSWYGGKMVYPWIDSFTSRDRGPLRRRCSALAMFAQNIGECEASTSSSVRQSEVATKSSQPKSLRLRYGAQLFSMPLFSLASYCIFSSLCLSAWLPCHIFHFHWILACGNILRSLLLLLVSALAKLYSNFRQEGMEVTYGELLRFSLLIVSCP